MIRNFGQDSKMCMLAYLSTFIAYISAFQTILIYKLIQVGVLQ